MAGCVSFEALQVALKHKKTVVQKSLDTIAVACMRNLQCTERGSVISGMLCGYQHLVCFNGRLKLKLSMHQEVSHWSWLQIALIPSFHFSSSLLSSLIFHFSYPLHSHSPFLPFYFLSLPFSFLPPHHTSCLYFLTVNTVLYMSSARVRGQLS